MNLTNPFTTLQNCVIINEDLQTVGDRMKKIFALTISALLVAVLMSSCKKAESQSAVLDISGAEISDDLFAYYLSTVMHNPKAYGLEVTSSSDEFIDCTSDLCADYVAVNSTFAVKKLRLTSDYKYDIAKGTSQKWDFYEKYYSTVGISKQSLTKALTAEAEKSMLFSYYYDEGGEKAVPTDEVKEYFNENYVSFRAINGYLTQRDEDGNAVQLSASEIKSIETKFSTMVDDLKTGSSVDEVYNAYATEQNLPSYSSDLMTINKDSNNYPSDFFEAVQKLEADEPTVIKTGDYIFLVIKDGDKDGEIFSSYRTQCLENMCSEDFNSLLYGITATYVIKASSAELLNVYYKVSAKF